MKYTPKKDLPKKQAHIYIYKDIERIIKGYGYKTSDFVTLKAIELLDSDNLAKEYSNNIEQIETLKNKEKQLTIALENCKKELSEVTERQKEVKELLARSKADGIEKALSDVMKLVSARNNSSERCPLITLNDVMFICAKYDVNFEFVLSKVNTDVLENHFNLRYKP